MPIINNVKDSPTLPWAELKAFEMNKLKKAENRDVSHLKNAIMNRGFKFPIYLWADHRYVLDGAGRCKALQELEDEGEVIPAIPVCWIEASSLQEAKYLVLMASSQHGDVTKDSWDEFTMDLDMESGIMDEIAGFEFDIGEIETLPAANGDPDEVPEAPEQPFTQPGDYYEIGDHRLVCGDSTDLSVLDKLMRGDMAQMIMTDPPYNVAYEGKTKDAMTIENDSMGNEEFYDFLYAVHVNMFTKAAPGCPLYVFHADSEGENFRRAFRESGFLLKQTLIWAKNTMVLGRQDYQWKHEPILYGWSPPGPGGHFWYSDRKQTTVLEFDKPARNGEHPTMKPIAILEYLLQQSSKTADIILDLFGGSGSTMVACHQQGRVARLVELDPKYCDVIVARMKRLFPDTHVTRNGVPVE